MCINLDSIRDYPNDTYLASTFLFFRVCNLNIPGLKGSDWWDLVYQMAMSVNRL